MLRVEHWCGVWRNFGDSDSLASCLAFLFFLDYLLSMFCAWGQVGELVKCLETTLFSLPSTKAQLQVKPAPFHCTGTALLHTLCFIAEIY